MGNMLSSFALECLGKSNACPFAAVLIIALKDTHPPCCPKGGSAATRFLPASLLCQLLQDRRNNLISHSYQGVKFLPWQFLRGNLDVLPLVAWKAEFDSMHFHTMQDSHHQTEAGQISRA